VSVKHKRPRNRHVVRPMVPGTTATHSDFPEQTHVILVQHGSTSRGTETHAALPSRVGFTNIATILGGAATTGLAAAALLPAAPIVALAASAIGSVAAYAVGKRLDRAPTTTRSPDK